MSINIFIYKRYITIGIFLFLVHPLIYFVVAATGPGQVQSCNLKPTCLDSIRLKETPVAFNRVSAKLKAKKVAGFIAVFGKYRINGYFGLMDELAVRVSLGMIFVDRTIKSVHTARRK